jgi:hypothetical protein
MVDKYIKNGFWLTIISYLGKKAILEHLYEIKNDISILIQKNKNK